MSIRENFVVPKRYNSISIALMLLGIIAIAALYLTTHGGSGTEEEKQLKDARFWASLLQNSVYFLLVVNASMFFICATTLAWGGWLGRTPSRAATASLIRVCTLLTPKPRLSVWLVAPPPLAALD